MTAPMTEAEFLRQAKLCRRYGAAVIASVISGKLAQRVGTKAIAVAGVAFLGLSGAVGVFATTMWQIVVVLILAGTGVAAASTAILEVYATAHGVDSIVVEWGYAPPGELADCGATFRVSSVEALRALLLR